jgi:hypothetical protein
VQPYLAFLALTDHTTDTLASAIRRTATVHAEADQADVAAPLVHFIHEYAESQARSIRSIITGPSQIPTLREIQLPLDALASRATAVAAIPSRVMHVTALALSDCPRSIKLALSFFSAQEKDTFNDFLVGCAARHVASSTATTPQADRPSLGDLRDPYSRGAFVAKAIAASNSSSIHSSTPAVPNTFLHLLVLSHPTDTDSADTIDARRGFTDVLTSRIADAFRAAFSQGNFEWRVNGVTAHMLQS